MKEGTVKMVGLVVLAGLIIVVGAVGMFVVETCRCVFWYPVLWVRGKMRGKRG